MDRPAGNRHMRAGLLRLPHLIPAAADRDLLRRFADARDEGAFAELVRRHGPLVLAVCRRVVSDSHLADDAFQATFVVLARKAATAGVGARLSTWLHSVAVKVSLRARTMAGRRAKRETLTATVPERGIASAPPDDATAVLDEEIDRLPESLRAAVVLCELRGVGRRDAAKELGIAEGTLSSRLAAARKKLAERLRARGVAPTVGIFSTIFVPTDLAAAAVAVSTGNVDLSPHLAQLVEGGLQMTLLTKLKLAAVAVAFAMLTVGGFGGRWGNESAAAPVPKDLADAGIIWMFHPAEGELVGYAPDGKKARTVKFAAGGTNPTTFFGITRDGQHALVAATKGKPPKDAKAGYDALHAGTLTVHLWPLHADAKPIDTGIGCQYWSRYVLGRDGKTLIVEHDRSPRDPQGVPEHPIKYETVAYDLTTFKGTKRPALEKGFWLVEELANRDRLLAFGQYGSDKRPLQSFHLLPAGSDKPKPLTGEDETDYCALSPDCTTLLVTRAFSAKWSVTDSYHRMFAINRATGKAEPFAHRPNTQHAHGHWSPDGTRVVYEWLEEGPQFPIQNIGGGLRTTPISRAQVVVTDATGKNEKVILDLDGCPETDLAKAQDWHDARPKLVGWYPARRANAPLPKAEADPGVIWCYDHTTGKLLAYRPNGDKLKEWTLPYGNWFKGVTPDGTRFVYGAEAGNKLPKVIVDSRPTLRLHARPIDDEEKFTDLGVPLTFLGQCLWSADGKRFLCGQADGKELRDFTGTAHTADGKELFKLNLNNMYPIGWLSDDTVLAVLTTPGDGKRPGKTKLLAVPVPDPRGHRTLFEAEDLDLLQASPDGKRVLGFDNFAPFADIDKPNKGVLVHDLAAKTTVAVARRAKQSYAAGLWSPDGTRIAYRWRDRKPDAGVDDQGAWQFVTCDADGKNETKLFADAPFTLQVTAWTATPPALRKNAPVPKAKLDGKIAVWQGDSVAVLAPDGQELSRHTRAEFGEEFGSAFVRLSPDGRRIALAWCDDHNRNNGHAAILSADGKKVEHAKGFIGAPWAAHWLPSDDANDPQFGVNGSLKLHFLSLKSGEMTDAIGNGYNATLAAAPNGVVVQQHDPKKRTLRLGTPEADDGDCFFVAEKDLSGSVCGVSRDGRTLLVMTAKGVVLHDAKTGDRVTVAEHTGCQAALAPNGEAVVMAARHEPKKAGEKPTYSLSVYDRATKETAVLVRNAKTPIRAVDFWSPPPPDGRKKNAPVPKEKDAGLLWVKDEKANQLTAYTPALEVAKRVKLPAFGKFLGLTPDGANIVYAARAGARAGTWYFLRPLDEDAPATVLELDHVIWDFPPIWSPDGKKFLRVRKDVDRKIPEWNSTVFRYDVFDLATKKAMHLADVPYDHWIMDWAADGKKFLTQSLRKGEEDTLHLMDADGTSKPLPAEEKAIRPYKLARSPDGKTFLFSSYDSLWAINAATGKRKELLDQTHGFPKPVWSPDGKRMAVAYCQTPTDDRVKPWEVQRLRVSDPDGQNRKELTLRDKAKGEDAYDVDFLGWFPAKADPAPVPKRNAPVPVPPKEDTNGLTASVTFDKKEIMLGEPIHFTFKVNNPTDKALQFVQGGDDRNRLNRPLTFTVTVADADGKPVPQPDAGIDMGGMSYLVKLPADGTATFRPLFLPHWATFEKPGEYTVTVRRKIGLVPGDAEDAFRAKATPVNLSATAKITVVPADTKKMGELIDALGKEMLSPKSDTEGAKKRLLEIRDPRVVPHFIELGKQPYPSTRSVACRALGKFKTDEAFAALKALYATTLADLHDGATAKDLDGLRHSAVGALADCGHPGALPLVWKAVEDGYMGVRMTVLHKAYEVKSPEARKVIAKLLDDGDDRVRGEARRYTDLLAKEKK